MNTEINAKLELLMLQMSQIQATTSELFRLTGLPEGPTLDTISNAVCAEFKLSKRQFLEKTRKPLPVMARITFGYIARKQDFMLIEIAAYLNQNHATVIHNLKDFHFRVEQFPEYAGQVEAALNHFGLKI